MASPDAIMVPKKKVLVKYPEGNEFRSALITTSCSCLETSWLAGVKMTGA